MEKVKLYNFADFFLNTYKFNIDEIKEGSEDAETQADIEKDKLINLLRQRKVELHIEQTRKFKELYLKLLAEETIKNSIDDNACISQTNISAAPNKKTHQHESSGDDDAYMVALLKKLTSLKKHR